MAELRVETFYPYPRELVWEALTDPAALNEWSMENDFLPVVGHKFQFHGEPNKHWNGILDAEVLEVINPSRLVYSCRGYYEGANTVVTITLEPSGNGTKLTVLQTGLEGFGGFIFAKLFLARGWSILLKKNFPVVLEHISRNGLIFDKSKPLNPGRWMPGAKTR